MSNRESEFDYCQAFCRNLGLISAAEQEQLRRTTIAIAGMGGVGGIHLMTLARLGIGGFHLADGDTFALANFNRQYGASMQTIGKNKAEVMAAAGLAVNPKLRLKVWSENISEDNITTFLEGVDLVVDGLDAFAIAARRTVFDRAQRKGIPVITAGPIGFGCVLLTFTANSLSFDEYFDTSASMPPAEQFARFVLGLAPELHFLRYMDTTRVDRSARHAPCVSSSVALCAGFAATEAIALILGKRTTKAVPYYRYFDPYLMEFKTGRIRGGNRNWLQRLRLRGLKRRLG